jgi:fatty acid desaturase
MTQHNRALSELAAVASPLADAQAGAPDLAQGLAPPANAARGEEFRDDLRPPGALNAQARKALSAQELLPFTQLDDVRSLLAMAQTGLLLVVAGALIVGLWGSPWMLAGVVLMGIAQHSLFILSHEAAHYRLLSHRGANDVLGRLIGMSSGVSMCTYRVTHRLHHNNLYGSEDPDTAIHGGYPRGRAYLLRKLAQDIVGWNAWKTYAYFFGAPAINEDTQRAIRPLDDTSPQLRKAARQDRYWVVGAHIAMPLLAYALADWHGLAVYLVVWILPLMTALQPILRLRAVCEHGAVSDLSSPLTAARSNRTLGNWPNRVLGAVLFPHHVNYHLEHHLYPAVPHYHLPALHLALQTRGVLDDAEVRDIPETLRMIFAPRKPKAAAGSSHV